MSYPPQVPARAANWGGTVWSVFPRLVDLWQSLWSPALRREALAPGVGLRPLFGPHHRMVERKERRRGHMNRSGSTGSSSSGLEPSASHASEVEQMPLVAGARALPGQAYVVDESGDDMS